MTTSQQKEALNQAIEGALGILNKDLVRRNDWGRITFASAEPDFKRAKGILDYLKVLPTEALPDNEMGNITTSIVQLLPDLKNIDQFNVETHNASVRDSYVRELHTKVDEFYRRATPWIPFLAYQKGDVTENLNKLSQAVEQSKNMVVSSKEDMVRQKKEMDEIIAAARTASVAAGAAVFTKDFEDESIKLGDKSKDWLISSIVCLFLTIGAALFMWKYALTTVGLAPTQLVQVVIAKIIILSMLITATSWCAGIYKALRHLASVNRHRALSLRTLKAFSASASDEQTKNAVLLEATRAVFSSGSTGYLDGKDPGPDSTLKIVEVAKLLGSKGTS